MAFSCLRLSFSPWPIICGHLRSSQIRFIPCYHVIVSLRETPPKGRCSRRRYGLLGAVLQFR